LKYIERHAATDAHVRFLRNCWNGILSNPQLTPVNAPRGAAAHARGNSHGRPP
jgi:hypothetical protein